MSTVHWKTVLVALQIRLGYSLPKSEVHMKEGERVRIRLFSLSIRKNCSFLWLTNLY